MKCAICTRVSTDEKLRQDFNSLDAQRECGEAFIKSQGWECIAERFDDGVSRAATWSDQRLSD
jgi:site-specific DNA recombinase